DFPGNILNTAKSIASKLIDGNIQKDVSIEAEIINEKISIILNKNVFSHVQGLLNDGHFFNAVEESYKIVRDKLKSITGKEKAHEAFSNSNYETIFGREPFNEAEADFYEGVKFLHMAIQKLRNEKAHTPARKIDKNLAIHYIVLASLAYDLIDRE
ncbi:MAG: TIGR02391 family protein, partial [bacterium]